MINDKLQRPIVYFSDFPRQIPRALLVAKASSSAPKHAFFKCILISLLLLGEIMLRTEEESRRRLLKECIRL